jgi:hypothetical protein
MLRKPIGNEYLGYGWWLRCYRCHRKWWLRHSEVELEINTPLRADRQSKIDRLSAFAGNNRRKTAPKKSGKAAAKYLAFIIIAVALYFIYQNRAVFNDYLISKAKHISESIAKKIVMTDVKYIMDDGKLSVSGDIANEDKIVVRINGVKVAVFDGDSEVLSWNAEPESKNILPEQKTSFSSAKPCPKEIKDIRVEVSVF